MFLSKDRILFSFQFTCYFLALYMSIVQLKKCVSNNDVASVNTKHFHSAPDIDFPTFTMCFISHPLEDLETIRRGWTIYKQDHCNRDNVCNDTVPPYINPYIYQQILLGRQSYNELGARLALKVRDIDIEEVVIGPADIFYKFQSVSH